MTSPIAKLAVAAAVLVAVSIGIGLWGGSPGSVAWAEVAERFESVPFFSATIYLGHGTAVEAHKIEIWKGEGPIVRAEEGDAVVFADLSKRKEGPLSFLDMGDSIIAFDRSTRQPVEPKGLAGMFLGILCPQGHFSLDSLMREASGEGRSMVTVQVADTPASRETVRFQWKDETTTERLDIWAMRNSKLPIRIRFVDPRNDECADFLFDYSEKKEATFFDPNAFASGGEN